MSTCQRVARPLAHSAKTIHQHGLLFQASTSLARSFSLTAARHDDDGVPPVSTTAPSPPTPSPPPPPPSSTKPAATPAGALPADSTQVRMQERLMDPNTTTAHWAERKLMRTGTPPVGSRRRRAALRTSQNISFDQLPYQCFQEARQILQQDRQEKLVALAKEIDKIKRIEATPADQFQGGQHKKDLRLASLRKYLHELKILVDINDPVVKRRFEDGHADMTKPIYRYLAEKKWRGLPYRIIEQRIETLNIVPDVLPKFAPVADVQMFFRRKKVEPGEILDSRVTELTPRLKVQVFNAGQRLVSVAVVDLDVPNAETDSFDRRCHYLAANIPIAPDQPSLPLGKVDKETQLAVPWLPAFSQMGAPYHRLAVFVLEQKDNTVLDVAELRKLYSGRDGFSLKSYQDKFPLTAVGLNIFRTVWDEGTAAVMERAGVPGADIMFKHKRVYSLKGPKKARGWEAKRSKPKYKSLWKYSKNIHGMNRRR
ncbi:phosphatidylethanolamine-binding protein [Astrocystis sublimbata]|nr:phosphatidylethanolamine-binding protein [Astrocystis sublimbata]